MARSIASRCRSRAAKLSKLRRSISTSAKRTDCSTPSTASTSPTTKSSSAPTKRSGVWRIRDKQSKQEAKLRWLQAIVENVCPTPAQQLLPAKEYEHAHHTENFSELNGSLISGLAR